jgi:predicted RNA-binding protein with PIN domain
MRAPSADPLAGTDRLLIDGTNLLHALRRDGVAAPPATLIGRLRGVVPAGVGIELVLDGQAEPGMHNARVASGLIVRYGGRRTGDDVLLRLVDEARSAGEDRAAVDNILVVTDDRQLRVALRGRGVRTAGTNWLIGRLERGRLSAPSTGNARGPKPRDAGHDRDEDRPGWRPGRGATTKHGNPRRRPRGTT